MKLLNYLGFGSVYTSAYQTNLDISTLEDRLRKTMGYGKKTISETRPLFGHCESNYFVCRRRYPVRLLRVVAIEAEGRISEEKGKTGINVTYHHALFMKLTWLPIFWISLLILSVYSLLKIGTSFLGMLTDIFFLQLNWYQLFLLWIVLSIYALGAMTWFKFEVGLLDHELRQIMLVVAETDTPS